MSVGSYSIEDGVGVITIDSPPVNALSHAVREAIVAGLDKFEGDDSVSAIVLACAGRTFFAGADISEFKSMPKDPTLHEVLDRIESASKPVVAAIHGTALGGGLETALVCHYRVAVPSAKVGLPEVHLGLLPGAGGTQRLPRLTGVEAALDMMVSGKPIKADKAAALGIIDKIVDEGRLVEEAVAHARLIADKPLPRVRDMDDKVAEARGKPEIFDQFVESRKRGFKGFKAPGHIVEAVRAAVERPFDEGIKRERELFIELLLSPESAAQRYYFFAQRETAKVPGIGKDVEPLDIASVGVIGAGTMGGGIAMNFLNIGIPVTLAEMNQEALDRGIGVIRRNYENTAKKGRMTSEQVEERMALIRPAIGLEELADVDLVIEAVFEEMGVKKDVFGKLDKIAKPGAILATNTSFLDVNEIASATSRPESVLGMHFFSPANVMQLLEIVRGEKSSDRVIATAMALAKKIRKIPVLSGVCFGFIANRIMAVRTIEAEKLALAGTNPQAIDKALVDYGFPMGNFQMWDLVGLDVVGRESDRKSIAGELVKLDRLGQKKNGGFYDYDEKRRATPSPVAAEVIARLADELKVEQAAITSDEEIVARLLYPVVNEGARVLEEGIALRASDIDVAAVLGYGWPVYRGGPMFWADMVGLDKIVAKLRDLGIEPSKLLVEKAEKGERFTKPS